MEMSVAVFVLCLVGAANVGFVANHTINRLRNKRRIEAELGAAARAEALQAELDEALRASRRESQLAEDLRLELDEASADLDDVRVQLLDSEQEGQRMNDKISILSRELAALRTNFSDIVGLEAEIASLRVIAARVPHLEERLAELEPEGPRVIDLREGAGPRRV